MSTYEFTFDDNYLLGPCDPFAWDWENAYELEVEELITQVGPTPPYNYGKANENVPDWAPAHGLDNQPTHSVEDSGLTSIMLAGSIALLVLVRKVAKWS